MEAYMVNNSAHGEPQSENFINHCFQLMCLNSLLPEIQVFSYPFIFG